MSALTPAWHFLQSTYLFWHAIPFQKCPTEWEGDLTPILDRAAEGDEQAIARVKRLYEDLPWPCDLPKCPATVPKKRIAPRIKGRKLDQIGAFIDATAHRMPKETRRLVDWCSGKSHLGRLAAKELNLPLLAIEIDPVLCQQGAEEALHAHVKADFHCQSVLDPSVQDLLQPGDFVFALHACGDLHAALIEAAQKRPILGLALAPCCFNRPGPKQGQPLSQEGKQIHFELSDSDLDLIHRQDLVAHERERAKCRLDRETRVSFDLWQRTARSVDTYQPVQAIPTEVMKLDFCERMYWLAHREGFSTAQWPDPKPYQAKGAAQLRRIEVREAIRDKFRRTLELCCLFDRQEALVEAGFEVDLSLFCPNTLTPRDALLFAKRP